MMTEKQYKAFDKAIAKIRNPTDGVYVSVNKWIQHNGLSLATYYRLKNRTITHISGEVLNIYRKLGIFSSLE